VLDFFGSTLVSVWLSMAGVSEALTASVTELQNTPWLVLPEAAADPDTQGSMQQYLKGLTAKGLSPAAQGIWLQSGPTLLASNQGTTPLPAASLTKVATSLVALERWGPDHRFDTLISATGPVQDGVLNGDLVITGGGDPLFVWEEAFAVGNALNQMGIRKVTGNLVITGNFQMNFEVKPELAGSLLKQGLNAESWSEDAAYQYQQLPQGTPRPKVAIAGTVQVMPPMSSSANQTVLMKHQSLRLTHIIKLMNLYSNNIIAESLANQAGGAQVVAQKAANLSGVPSEEILLTNGSGLGAENRLSPRAVCAMFATIQRYLESHSLTVADLFPIAGIDAGTIDGRKMPKAAVVKTGTLNDVSALAGVVPTRDRGLIWFTIINRGTNLDDLRDQQDVLLQTLVDQWGSVKPTPVAIAPRQPAQAANLLRSTNQDDILFESAPPIQSSGDSQKPQ
jgi:D-alanyl-D-alanine carboxypeptidase/D-alanyl-D-alanine-endopeptidase (penicillin-binding protein 4)